jgi:type VI secretion system protein ImpC
MQVESWRDLPNPRVLSKIFLHDDYAAWTALRYNARYVGLAMPRFLARLPYGAKTSPMEEFRFEEDAGNADHSLFAWANSAYAIAVNIHRSFKTYGWFSNICGLETRGAVEGKASDIAAFGEMNSLFQSDVWDDSAAAAGARAARKFSIRLID